MADNFLNNDNYYNRYIKTVDNARDEFDQQLNQYKQALDEIEKIAQDIANTKEWINCTYNALEAELILGIIDKVREP